MSRAPATRWTWATSFGSEAPVDHVVIANTFHGVRKKTLLSPEETRAMVEPAGFEQVAVVELPPYHYGLVFGKARGGDAEMP